MQRPLAATPSPARSHAADRWFVANHVLFYGALTIAASFALAQPGLGWRPRVLSLGLALLCGGWYAALVLRRPQWWRQPAPMLIYFVGMLVLWVALTMVHPIYMLLIFALYPQFYSLLPLRWAAPGSIALVALTVWRQAAVAGEPITLDSPLLLAGLASAVFNVALTAWIGGVINQSTQRQQLIEELERTRHELALAERQAGVLEERQRLAREIHDTLAQGFTSIVMHLEAAESALPPQARLVAQHLDQARQAARDSLTEARRLVWALRPDLLERASLADALRQVGERWQAESGIPARIAVTGTPRPLPPEAEVTLLRVAQEALANVRKHARASQIDLTLSYIGDSVILDVQDNGVGLVEPGAASATGGFGVQGMRERVAQLGGSLTLESTPGEGTTLVVELPGDR